MTARTFKGSPHVIAFEAACHHFDIPASRRQYSKFYLGRGKLYHATNDKQRTLIKSNNLHDLLETFK